MKLTTTEKRVLRVLLEHERTESNVCTFALLETWLGTTTRRAVKTACRKLARKGFAEHGPYWTYDGKLGGTGYSLTTAGTTEARRAEELADDPR